MNWAQECESERDENNLHTTVNDNESKSKAFNDEIVKLKKSMREEETYKKSKWEIYCDNCLKYHVAPVLLLKDVIDMEMGKLNLSHYMPRSIGVQLICDALLTPPISKINEIDFSDSPFSASACDPLGEFLTQNLTLTKLNLARCGIGHNGIEILNAGIYFSESVTELNLSHCKLNDADGALIAKTLISNEICQILDLSHNGLSSAAGKMFGEMLGINTTLLVLELNWNQLFPEADSIVPLLTGLSKNVCLRRLGLAWNGLIGEQFAKNLRKALAKNKSIEELNLEFNLISAKELSFIVQGIKKSQSLKKLWLAGNLFGDGDIKLFVSSINWDKTVFELLSFGDDARLSSELETSIQKAHTQRPKLTIHYNGVQHDTKRVVDFSAILIDRCKFLAMKPKKQKLKRDMGEFFAQKLRDGPQYCTAEDFNELINAFNAKINNDGGALIKQIIENWTEKIGKSTKVNLEAMCNDYLKRHPYELVMEVPEKHDGAHVQVPRTRRFTTLADEKRKNQI